MRKSNFATFAGLTLAALVFAAPAYASGSGMPWEGPLQQVLDSLTGPVARAAAVSALTVTFCAFMFGEGGSAVKRFGMVGFCIAGLFAITTWGLQLFGFAGGAVF